MLKQLIVFFALAYSITWLIWLPLWAPGLHLPALPLQHGLGGLGPALAAIITTAIFSKKEVKPLLQSMLAVRPIGYLSVALLSPFVIYAIAVLAEALVSNHPVDFTGLFRIKDFPQWNLLQYAIYNLVFFGFGEETGWRGFALPRLQSRMNALSAAIILTLFWALWHWPAFFYRPGYMGMDMGGIAGWVFSLLTGSILLSWLFNSSRGSLVAVAIFHTTVDLAFTADMPKAAIGYMGAIITVWGIITIIIFKPKNLAKEERVIKLNNSKSTQ